MKISIIDFLNRKELNHLWKVLKRFILVSVILFIVVGNSEVVKNHFNTMITYVVSIFQNFGVINGIKYLLLT